MLSYTVLSHQDTGKIHVAAITSIRSVMNRVIGVPSKVYTLSVLFSVDSTEASVESLCVYMADVLRIRPMEQKSFAVSSTVQLNFFVSSPCKLATDEDSALVQSSEFLILLQYR